jgi:cytidine diphosphoramidate kinase
VQGVVWITGLSGAGKTTVACRLVAELRARGHRPVLIDGDDMREMLPVPIGHTAAERRRVARFYSRLCRYLSEQGQIVVCATISLFHEIQAWNRSNIGNYLEVLLTAPAAELARRDRRGLYQGNGPDVVGVDLDAEFPAEPDLVIVNDHGAGPGDAATQIAGALAAWR